MMTIGMILTKLFLVFTFITFASPLYAAGYNCQYLNEDKTQLIKFRFAIDSKPQFGTIVPIEVLNKEDKDDLIVKTVVIKDKPFVVLTDVQRMKYEDDRILLIYVYPERDRIKILNFNGGKDPVIGVNHAKCTKLFD